MLSTPIATVQTMSNVL